MTLRSLAAPLAAFGLAPSAVDVEETPGGLSGARIFRVQSPRGETALRRWPAGRRDVGRIEQTFARVAAAANAGCGFLASADRTVAGDWLFDDGEHLWSAADWKPGTPPAETERDVAACATALAQLHQAWAQSDPNEGPPPVAERALAAMDRLRGAAGETLSAAVTSRGLLGPSALLLLDHARRLAARSSENLADAASCRRRLHFCLRDARPDHFLLTRGTVTGLIDYDAAAVDSPLADLARLAGGLGKVDSPLWRVALESYAAGSPIASEEVVFCELIASCSLAAAAANWLHWIYVEGREFNDPAAVQLRCRRLLHQLSTSKELD